MSGIDIDRIVDEAVEKSPYIPCLSVKNPFAAARRAAEMAAKEERDRWEPVVREANELLIDVEGGLLPQRGRRINRWRARADALLTPEEAPEPRPKWWKCPKCGKERTGCDGNCKGAPDA